MDIRIPQSNVSSSAADEAITKEMHDGLRRATITVSSLEAEQGSGNISKTQTKATPFGPSSPRTSSEGPTSPVGTQHTPTIIEISPNLQNISITYRKTKTRTGRMGIRIPQSNVPSSAADEAITKEMHDGLGRATTTVSSLEAEQGSGDISKTQTKATPSGPSSPRTSSEDM
nr:hypothetical protein [Tanacetum cinerariifolium]